MKRFLYAGVTALVGLLAAEAMIGIVIIRMGLAPINADAAPSSLEKRVLASAVRASVGRRASEEVPPPAPSDDDLRSGEQIYQSLCAQCHGRLNGKESALGASFYPPAPQLPGRGTSFNEAEVFWIVKHGIRNTSMPSWRRLLSDEEVWRVAAFVKRMNAQGDNQTAETDQK